MLTGWIVRLAGQQLAPDPKCKETDADSHSLVDANSPFWQAIAPMAATSSEETASTPVKNIGKETSTADEKGEQNRGVTFQSPPKNDSSTRSTNTGNDLRPLLCSQCSKVMDTNTGTGAAISPFATPSHDGTTPSTRNRTTPRMMETPKSIPVGSHRHRSAGNRLFSPRRTISEHSPALVQHVMDAAVGVAKADPNHKQLRMLFTSCFSTFSCAKIKKLLMSNSSNDNENNSATALRYLYARSPDGSASSPSGYTPFMAAVHGGNLGAVQTVWECVQFQLQLQMHDGGVGDAATVDGDAAIAAYLQLTDMFGHNLLHIAYRAGKADVTQWLKTEVLAEFNVLETLETAVDVAGLSPAGWALMSTQAAVRSKVVPNLQTDPSVQGTPFLPKEERLFRTSGLAVGLAELPGVRIRNEDYTTAAIVPDSIGTALVTVADGHSDQGEIAKFVAEGSVEAMSSILQSNTPEARRTIEEWSSTLTQLCLELDAQLRKRKAEYSGGAVASICVMTPNQFVVANVGDCRCILIAAKESGRLGSSNIVEQTEEDLLVQATAKLSLTSKQPLTLEDVEVIALSTDHKPSIPAEAERAVAAGCSIYQESFQTKAGDTETIEKIQLRDGENVRVAFSRSFGDFDYKARKDLDATAQAVIAVPEVVVHDRDVDRDLYLVVACDGIWDVYSNEQVAEHVLLTAAAHAKSADPAALSDALLQSCLRDGAKDNMSVAVVSLQEGTGEPLPVGRSLEAEGYEL